jgi:hypothetical protein
VCCRRWRRVVEHVTNLLLQRLPTGVKPRISNKDNATRTPHTNFQKIYRRLGFTISVTLAWIQIFSDEDRFIYCDPLRRIEGPARRQRLYFFRREYSLLRSGLRVTRHPRMGAVR